MSTSPTLRNSEAVSAPAGIGLSLQARPPILPADGGTYDALVLQFKNLTSGVPYIPQTNQTVLLSSSNNQTGTVPGSVVYPAGSPFVIVQFTTTTLAGLTTVTALSQGYPSASQIVSTERVGGIPTALNVYLAPSQLPPNAKLSGNVIVQVVDTFGNPIKLAGPLSVTLSSSNSQVGSVPPTLTIPKGSTYASAAFTPTYVAGTTTITASALGLSTGSAVMTTTGAVGRKLVVSIAPSTILANDAAQVSIQLQDNSSATPAIAQSPVQVVITSSNAAIANFTSVPSGITYIAAGSSYTTVTINAKGSLGNATVTASAQGYQTGSAVINVVSPGSGSAELGLSFAPNTLLPNNATYPGAVVVELLSSAGVPVAATSPITVFARSSNNASMLVSTSKSWVINTGQTHVAIDISSTFLPGSASITAQSAGLGAATSNLLSFGSAANAISIQFAPASILSDGGTYPVVVVSLINLATRSPAIAPVNTHINLATSQSSLGQIQSFVTIPAGQTYALADYTTLGIPGTTVITASASNYTSSNSTLSLVVPPATKVAVYAVPGSVVATGSSYPSLVVQLQDQIGNPVKTNVPIPVQLSAQNLTVGSVSPTVTIEPGNTSADATLTTTSVPGSLNITAFANGFAAGQAQVKSILIPMKVQAYLSSTSLFVNAKANVTVYVQAQGTPLSGASVTWQPATLGTLSSMQNITNSAGIATALFQAGRSPGGLLLRVTVAKAGYTLGQGNTSIAITSIGPIVPPPKSPSGPWAFLYTPIWIIPLWMLIPVIAGGGVGGFFFLRWRRGRGADDDGSDDDDGFGSSDDE